MWSCQGNDLTPASNFSSLFKALSMLMRCMTGESWEQVMISCWKNPNGSEAAPYLFISFVIFTSFIVVNLFIMIIVDELDSMGRTSEGMQSRDVAVFNAAWSVMDPKGTKFIDVSLCCKGDAPMPLDGHTRFRG